MATFRQDSWAHGLYNEDIGNMVLAPILLHTNWHSVGDIVNITLAAFTLLQPFPGKQFWQVWPWSLG